jgi:hypothetical protein
MRSILKLSAAVPVILLAGCVTMPAGPSMMVLPGTGKTFDQFRFDDQDCRQFASSQIGGASAQQAANDSTVNSAVVGTAIGALAGAAIGGHQGAGVGAATGLLVGSSAGSNAGVASGYALQRRYDIAYQQCMYAKGHRVPAIGHSAYPSRPAYNPPAPEYLAPPPPPNTPPPPPPNTPPPPRS